MFKTGDGTVAVWDTKRENQLILHMVNKLPDPVDLPLVASVNKEVRIATENNHSATHLLHAALRKVLGNHVQQRGSLVNSKELRFDFSHFSKMTQQEITGVERLVNEKIRENIAREVKDNVPLGEAKAMGATALFGEKYGDEVRVVCFDPEYSIELCGGTHVPATGQIGLFKILSEGSIASGVRRIEATTGLTSEALVDERFGELDQISELLKSTSGPVKAVKQLLDERNKLQKDLETIQHDQVKSLRLELLEQVIESNGDQCLIAKVKLPSAQALKDLSFELKNQIKRLFAVLAVDVAGKPQIAVIISEELVDEYGWNAGTIVRELAKHISGGGGGQPFFATAGGKNLDGLDTVTEEAKRLYDDLVVSNEQNT